MVHKSPFSAVKPEHLYTISKIVAQASDTKAALDEISVLVHSHFIFDNLVVYRIDPGGSLDVFYARAMGRGRSSEADIAWGEIIANQVTLERKTILEEPSEDSSADRLNRPYMLGIPLCVHAGMLGLLVFIRFGGPHFEPQEVELSEFLGEQLALLLERYNLQNELRLAEAQNQQARLQESFISTITHELRSPLGFIKGYTTTLLRSDMTWDHATQQEFLAIIDQETDHLEELIENLLDSARLQSGQLPMNFQMVRLDVLLNDVIARASLHYPGIALFYTADKTPAAIQADPRRLAQVFENIISNAIKYAPKSPVWITITHEDANLHIQLRDAGPGIPQQHLPHIFKRFFRNPDQTPGVHGSGLGLFICEQIIQAHQGRLTADSVLGAGTTFHIFLPIQSGQAAQPNPNSEVKA